MQQPVNQSKKYEHLFTDIDTGRIKIPMFQRDFVWSLSQTASLIDSIIKGYPIGTFIFWKTRERMRYVKNIGNIDLPEIPSGDVAFYVLDGQQRISSLYAVRKGIRVTKEGNEINYNDICINLELDPNSDDQLAFIEPPANAQHITVHKLLNGTVTQLAKEFKDDMLLEKIDVYRNRLTGYDFSVIEINEYSMETACDVFTRINTGGTELALFEIMVAKTYDEEKGFDLSHEFDYLIDNDGAEKDLEDVGFETIPSSAVLQCISAHLIGSIRRQDILKLDRDEFINAWPDVKEGIFTAVDYLRTYLRIPVSRILPYYALLIPFSFFFIKNRFKMPNAFQDKQLTKYFWWASLSNRFTSGLEGKVAQDLKRMESILNKERPDYQGEELTMTSDKIEWKEFSSTDSFCKAIICLYAYAEPKSFSSNGIVHIGNSWLKQANSRNYHHFFPSSYLTKQAAIEKGQANSIVNITLVDANLNKKRIGSNPPSKYMSIFTKENEKLQETMKSHYIDNMDTFGVWDNDYKKFIHKRAKRIVNELNKRLSY